MACNGGVNIGIDAQNSLLLALSSQIKVCPNLYQTIKAIIAPRPNGIKRRNLSRYKSDA
jgi:hypothetical protein